MTHEENKVVESIFADIDQAIDRLRVCALRLSDFLTAQQRKADLAKSECVHEHIHMEGSLGYFCDRCGAPQ